MWFYENLVYYLYYKVVFREKIDVKIIILIKFNFDKLIIFYLYYLDFDIDFYFVLKISIFINMNNGKVEYRNYSNYKNFFVLYWKEIFVIFKYF